MGDLRTSRRMLKSRGRLQFRTRSRGSRGVSVTHVSSCPVGAPSRRGPGRPPGPARRGRRRAAGRGGVRQPADWTPHVLDGKVDAIVQVGDKMVAGGLFTRVANAAAPIPRSNIFAFDPPPGWSTPRRQPMRRRRPLGDRRHRPGRRRPLLAVPRPVRPQLGQLTGPWVRYPALHHAPVAQGTEQLSPKQQVAGSSPARGTKYPSSQVRRPRRASREVVAVVLGVAQRSTTPNNGLWLKHRPLRPRLPHPQAECRR
jgi:hypothetical protein